jgi:DNA-binding NarL/FixJ family response regulator
MNTYAILLADDHIIVRRGIRRMIEEDPDLEVVGEAGDGIDLLRLLRESRADMVILDISMPNLGGIEAAKEIKKTHPHIKVLILTMHKGKELLHHAISNGADGYMLKEESEKELYSAIGKIRQGGVYISPHLAEELTDDYVNLCRGTFNQASQILTRREKEILKFIADGKSSREIANTLFISVRTVENHRSSIMDKMGVKRMVDLIKDAIQKGYIS